MLIINRIYNPDTIRITYYDDFGVQYLQPPAGADIVNKPYSYFEAMDELRLERDRRLTKCDWTQLPDVPLTPAQIDDWRTYRKQLRDTPEMVDLMGWEGAANWPTAPKLN